MLSVRGLSVRFLMPGGRRVAAVTDARFDVAPGACLTLIGESGCGKSVPASALLGLLPGNARTAELVPAVGLPPACSPRGRTRSATAGCNVPASPGPWCCAHVCWCATR